MCKAPTHPIDGPLGLQARSSDDDIALISDPSTVNISVSIVTIYSICVTMSFWIDPSINMSVPWQLISEFEVVWNPAENSMMYICPGTTKVNST